MTMDWQGQKIEEILNYIASEYSREISLKPKQREALKLLYENDCDMIVNLPVGYGKSLLFHLLPSLFRLKNPDIPAATVLVVAPLNIIQQDHLLSLQKHNIPACRIDVRGNLLTNSALNNQESDNDQEDNNQYEAYSSASLEDIVKGTYDVVYCHPEELLNTSLGEKLLNNKVFQKNVVAVVVDECHIVEEWGKSFRRAFAELHCLSSFFPRIPHIALSGTLTQKLKKKLPEILGLRNPMYVEENPDKHNIKLSVHDKCVTRDYFSIYEDIYMLECNRLRTEGKNYPVTMLYMPMKYMSHAMAYLSEIFGNLDISCSPYSALYSGQDKSVQQITISELQKETPRIRLILSTSVSGMGFDPPAVTRVIHSRPPRSISQYFQEIGRAGRRGQKSQAILYFNGNDISKNLPGIEVDIIEYCRNKERKCLRELILNVFGFLPDHLSPLGCLCCSICELKCTCDKCLVNV